ncbi:MAG: PIN domain-containing protein [Terriglobia bacterium]
MNSYVEAINTYRTKGLLIDTNLLLLLFVGFHGRKGIQRFKRTIQFTPEDFDCLARVIRLFKLVVTTPSVLTEVSNLLGQLPEGTRRPVFQILSRAIPTFHENFTSSRDLAQAPCFPKFGLTDAGIVQSAKGELLVLTDDFRLAGYLASHGIDVINFNHLRMSYLFSN